MSAVVKAEMLAKVASFPLPKRKILRELGIPKSTYYPVAQTKGPTTT